MTEVHIIQKLDWFLYDMDLRHERVKIESLENRQFSISFPLSVARFHNIFSALSCEVKILLFPPRMFPLRANEK